MSKFVHESACVGQWVTWGWDRLTGRSESWGDV